MALEWERGVRGFCVFLAQADGLEDVPLAACEVRQCLPLLLCAAVCVRATA